MDHDCFVIASGPSLLGFDFSRLPDVTRIGANKSAWLADCDIMVTLDRHFPRKCKAEIEAFQGEKVFAVSRDDTRYHDDTTYVKRERGDGFASEGALRGYDSGFAALNLAWQRGYKSIGLLGFDYKWTERSHFHEGYRDQNKKTHMMLQRWVKEYEHIAHLVNAVNYVGPKGSNLTLFPTRPLEDLQ